MRITAKHLRAAGVEVPKRSKYAAVKTEVDGFKFDSKAEARRYGELKLMERAGEITGLRPHVPYYIVINGELVCSYESDFTYVRRGEAGETVEDVKSVATMTPVYRLKRKLMRIVLGIEIVEVGVKRKKRKPKKEIK